MRSAAYMALDCGLRPIPHGGSFDTDASNRDLNMEKMDDCTADQGCEGYWDSNSFTKSWQNI